MPQASFCLSSNHVRCPLYTGEELPSTQVAPVVTPLPQGGFQGWLSGLSARDRRIYAILVGLLGLIILAYVVSGVVLFSGDQEPTTVAVFTPTAPVALTTATSVPPTAAPSGTPNRFATAAVLQTQTAEARGSATPSGSPSPSASPSGSPSPSASPAASATTAPIFIPPTAVVVPPTGVPTTAPTPAPTEAPATAVPATAVPATAVPATAVPTISLPTITLEFPTAAPTDPPATTAPTSIPPTLEVPTAEPAPTEAPAGRASSAVAVFFADPAGRVLVPVTRQIAPTRQARTAAINQLIAGPSGGLSRLVPADTRLLSLRISGGLATADFNRLPTYGNESPSDLGLRSVVLALTEQPDVTQVQIQVNRVNSGPPRYRPTVNPDNPDQLNGQFDTTSFLPLYYPAVATGQMVRVMRLVPRTKAEATGTIEQLIVGPGPYGDVLGRPVPGSTTINRLVINAGVAELDLGSGFLQASNQRQAVDSILLALTTFPSIQQVRVSVDGTPLAAFWGDAYGGALARPPLNPE